MPEPSHHLDRRAFLSETGAATALTAASYRRVLGAGERVGIGFIGYGLIGKRHVADFLKEPDVDAVAASDVHRGRLAEAVAATGGRAKGESDFRRLLDDKAVHAVVLSTPDHWHVPMALFACAAGKDVYVEKPMTLFVREGRWLADAAKRTGRVVQVGTQQRSGKHYQRARDLIRGGAIGKVVSVRCHSLRNAYPGFGNPPDQEPPADLDWNAWLGPAPARKYNPHRGIYFFRWMWDTAGGQMTNIGAHHFDIIDWVLGLGTLRAVTSAGGRFALTDNFETPDVQDALFEFDGWTASWSLRECSRGAYSPWPLEFYGTKGSLGITRKGFAVTPDPDTPAVNTIPGIMSGHPVGGPIPATLAAVKPRTESLTDVTGSEDEQFRGHVRNFLDCVKSRAAPRSDAESGHRTATACHLANLSLRLGRKLRWDAKSEAVIDDAEANRALVRPYRAPWDRELKATGVNA